MKVLAYILAGLIVLIRVYVPISDTVIGQWTARLILFILWSLVILVAGGDDLARFYRTLMVRRLEMAFYAIWVALLVFFWLASGGEHLLTSYLLNAYIGTIPFYLLGTYYPLADRRGRGLAVAMLLVVGGSCLQAIPSVWKSPELVRISAITADNEIRSLSIGNYGELTGLALVLPFFLTLALQSKRYVRVTGIISCLATMALLMIATFSGLILLTSMAVCGCILFYLVIGGIRLNRFIWAVAAILAVGVAAAYILPSIYRRPEIGRFYDKLANTSSSVASVVAGQATDPTQRYTLMLDSLYVFLENPITGVALGAPGVESSGAGGHSSWMDALAMYGVLGGVPYLLFHLLVFYRLWQAWRCEHHNALHWGCLLSCGFYIFYSFFNVTTQGTTVALFLYVVAAGGQRTRVPSRFRNLILTNSTGNR